MCESMYLWLFKVHFWTSYNSYVFFYSLKYRWFDFIILWMIFLSYRSKVYLWTSTVHNNLRYHMETFTNSKYFILTILTKSFILFYYFTFFDRPSNNCIESHIHDI